MRTAATQQNTLAARPERASGVYQTSPGLLRRRLLGPWAEGLAQYLLLRLGDLSRARAAYGALLRMITALPPGELVEPPGPKARLYRLARSIAETERAMPGRRADPRGLAFVRPDGRRGAALEALRRALSRQEAELIELRYARELEIAEIAFVLETPSDEVELALDTAEARARRILGEEAPDPLVTNASIFVEAFALRDESEAPAIDEDAPLEAGTIVGGRYRLVERVGVGAFGDVYRAEDTEVPGHRVALKLLRQPSLSESARTDALRELRMNAAVFHPSLVQFKDHGWFDQRLWFVMPWYDGETLEQRMRREPLSRPEARCVFERLARALAALHAARIRHQDIKPDNVLLTRLPGSGDADDILPVLIDLGVAAREQEGLLGGTPLYFAPEVAARFASASVESDDVEIGTPADVFALALSLRNALEPESQDYVRAGAIGAFIDRRARERPSLPQSRALRFLRPHFSRWLSPDPNERPSAEEFAKELAILTAPEERRARIVRAARWLVPSLVLIGVIFGAVVHQLEQRAIRRELEAQRARMAVADARADLLVADSRRRALEQGNAELLDRYEQSRLSRHELASSLATTEGQLRILGRELSARIGELSGARERLVEARGVLAERELELGSARGQIDALRGDLATSRSELTRRESELGEQRARARELSAQLAAERSARRDAEERSVALAAELTQARDARDTAERELSRVREHVAELAALLARPEEGDPQASPEDPAEP